MDRKPAKFRITCENLKEIDRGVRALCAVKVRPAEPAVKLRLRPPCRAMSKSFVEPDRSSRAFCVSLDDSVGRKLSVQDACFARQS